MHATSLLFRPWLFEKIIFLTNFSEFYDSTVACGFQYNLDIKNCTVMDFKGKHLNADEVKLLARFLGEPKVQGRIKLLNLRFVLRQLQPQYINLDV